MRVFIGIIIFFLFLLGLGVYMEIVISRQSEALLQTLDGLEMEVLKNDFAALEEQVKKLNRLWTATRKVWVLLIDHRELDEFELSLARAKSYLENQVYIFALTEIVQMKQIINQIPDKQRLSLENIL
ncbi:MAG TPA: DUF4363 family protein [Firmicutes bacterium]|mgnify:CR=1 FL=1|jgi:hypothetical protein|nr:DUF4363 family protein [Bacillota bacterium]